MKKYLARWPFFILILFITVSLFTAYVFFNPQSVLGDTSKILSGFAWSSNIGWIQMDSDLDNDDGDYPVTLSGSGTTLAGYAWSSNIGWIRFDPIIGVDGNALPAGQTGSSAQIAGNLVTGWIRACSVFKTGCAGNSDVSDDFGLKPDSARGGWDGWINLGGTSPNYGVTFNPSTGEFDADGSGGSFAWGATNVGWINFCPKNLSGAVTNACVSVNSLNAECHAYDAMGTEITEDNPINIDEQVTFTVTVGNSNPAFPYEFCWGQGTGSGCGFQDNIPGDVDALNTVSNSINSENKTFTASDLAVGSLKRARVMVTDNLDRIGEASCLIKLKDNSQSTLTVYVNGNDTGGNKGMVDSQSPASPSIVNCRASDGSCSAIYLIGTVVTLKALPDLIPPLNTVPYSFNWETGVCDSNPTPDTCQVTMSSDSGRSVTVNFYDPNQAISLDASPKFIKIVYQDAGRPATSNKSVISNNSAIPANVCVESFVSVSGTDINTVTNTESRVQCNGGSVTGRDCRPNFCFNIGPNSTADFSVKVPDKSARVNNGSPYRIKLKAGLGEVIIRFEYQVSDVGP
ncbi:MAG: hypothetical protein AAB677_00010 [Patescibacteria group bacterium]